MRGRANIESMGSRPNALSAIGLPMLASPLDGAALIMRADAHASDVARAIYDDASLLFTLEADTMAQKLIISLIPPFETRELKTRTAQLTRMCKLL